MTTDQETLAEVPSDNLGGLRIARIRPLVYTAGTARTFLFVSVETDQGVCGLGEGSQNDQDGSVVAAVRQLESRLIGQDPLNSVEKLTSALWSQRTGRAVYVAVSAIEQALWDIAGKMLGVPVYKLLGGAVHESLRCYVTLHAGLDDFTPKGLADEARRCVQAGHHALKINPFQTTSSQPGVRDMRELLAISMPRLEAVREAVGDDCTLMIESAFALDMHLAKRLAQELAHFDCYWIEAPLPWDDAPSLATLRQSLPLRVASGETLHGRAAFRDLIERRAVDVLQPDVKWTGGILEAKKIAAWAEAYQISVAPHNNSGPVATAASAHLSATLPNFEFLESASRPAEWESEAVDTALVISGGHVDMDKLSARPGLGIELQESVMERWRLM